MASAPLYLQIAEQLAREIASGAFPVGSQLPTEAELCTAHAVSRSTAREALRCLVDRGMISRRARLGSHVISAAPVGTYQPVASGPDDLVALATGTRIVAGESNELVADESLARRLGCEPGAALFLFAGPRHLRGRDTAPLCWSQQYMRADVGARGRERLVRGDFSAGLAAQRRIEQVVTAETLSSELAERLDADAGAPALVITRRHYLLNGAFLAAGVQTHPADRYELRVPIAGLANELDGENVDA